MDRSGFEGIITFGNGTGNDFFGFWKTSSPRIQGMRHDGTFNTIDYPTNLNLDQWYHACCVFTSTTSATMYIDGDEGNTETATIAPSNPTFIGFANIFDGSPLNNFQGRLCEFGIWDVALTADEISDLANGSAPIMVRPGSLKHYFPMWDASDTNDRISGDDVDTVTGTPDDEDHPGQIYYPAEIITVSQEAAAAAAANPRGVFGHPLHGAFAGPVGP